MCCVVYVMFRKKGTKRRWSSKDGSSRKGGFKRRKGYGPSRGPFLTGPFGPAASQFGAGKGITDQAILYKTLGVPGRIALKLRSSYSGVLTSTSGGFNHSDSLAYINSVNDPAGTVGSIKPAGYVNWFGTNSGTGDGVYTSYIVTAARMKLHCFAAAANTVPVNVGIRFKTATALAPASSNEFQGNSLSRCSTVGLPGAKGEVTLILYATVAQVASESMATVAIDDSFASLSDANPASLLHCAVFSQSTDASSTTNVLYRAELTQWVVMFGRKSVEA